MSATTCTLTRSGEVADLAGPWQALVGDLDAFLVGGVDGLVPARQREAFRRALAVALADGRAGTEHAVDLPGLGRRWLAWSLARRSDGRIDAVVIDTTAARAAGVWTTASTLAPRLVAVAPDLHRARRVLTELLGRELDGAASLVLGRPGATADGRGAPADHRSRARWPGDGPNGTDCLVTVPLAWPGGRHALLSITTPYRLDLHLDEVHLDGLRRDLEQALEQAHRTARDVESLARERLFVEQLGRELHRPLDLLRRTLGEASRNASPEQRSYLLQRAATLAERLGRITGVVRSAAGQVPGGAPESFPLAVAVSDALAGARSTPQRVDVRVPPDSRVVADRGLLTRALAVLFEVLSDHAEVVVETSTTHGVLGLRVTSDRGHEGAPDDPVPALASIGLALVGDLVAASGGDLQHAAPGDGGTGLVLLLPAGDERQRPR